MSSNTEVYNLPELTVFEIIPMKEEHALAFDEFKGTIADGCQPMLFNLICNGNSQMIIFDYKKILESGPPFNELMVNKFAPYAEKISGMKAIGFYRKKRRSYIILRK